MDVPRSFSRCDATAGGGEAGEDGGAAGKGGVTDRATSFSAWQAPSGVPGMGSVIFFATFEDSSGL